MSAFGGWGIAPVLARGLERQGGANACLYGPSLACAVPACRPVACAPSSGFPACVSTSGRQVRPMQGGAERGRAQRGRDLLLEQNTRG
jgi:hypothetical protein